MYKDATKDFVERLKLAAQEVIDNAEDIVGNHDAMTEVEVTITVRTLSDRVEFEPEIRVNKSFYSDRVKTYLFEDWKGGSGDAT